MARAVAPSARSVGPKGNVTAQKQVSRVKVLMLLIMAALHDQDPAIRHISRRSVTSGEICRIRMRPGAAVLAVESRNACHIVFVEREVEDIEIFINPLLMG